MKSHAALSTLIYSSHQSALPESEKVSLVADREWYYVGAGAGAGPEPLGPCPVPSTWSSPPHKQEWHEDKDEKAEPIPAPCSPEPSISLRGLGAGPWISLIESLWLQTDLLAPARVEQQAGPSTSGWELICMSDSFLSAEERKQASTFFCCLLSLAFFLPRNNLVTPFCALQALCVHTCVCVCVCVCVYLCIWQLPPAHVIYPAVKHLLCKALIKASAGRIDKPFFTTTA